MIPAVAVVSDEDALLRSIVTCISTIECSNFFSTLLGKSQTDQKLLVSDFQVYVARTLNTALQDVGWSIEHCPNLKKRDSIDIFGRGVGFVVVIELDKHRADQVAKKFVSRMALFPETIVYFVSLCYPGTEKMNKAECIKYFGYCSALALRMDCHYAGLIIG